MLFLSKSRSQFLVVLWRFFIWITPGMKTDVFCIFHNNHLQHYTHCNCLALSKCICCLFYYCGYWQARSQDLEKGGGGLFWKSEKCANDLDSSFHWPWISFRRFVRNLRQNVSERSEIQRFFPPKIRWSPKKKKKKKRSSPKFRVIFRPKSKIQTFFPPKIGWSPTKKKKKKRSSPKFRAIFLPISQVQTFEGGLFSYGGGYFPFFTQNRLHGLFALSICPQREFFSSRFIRAVNISKWSNQISRIRVTAKKFSQQDLTFFSSMLFSFFRVCF